METKDILKYLRKSKGFNNAKDFCEAVDISINTYQNYETGKRIPTAEMLIKLADFYGVTTDYLLGRNTEEIDTLSQLANEFDMSALEKKIVENYFSLDKSMRGNLMEFLQQAVSEVEQECKEKARQNNGNMTAKTPEIIRCENWKAEEDAKKDVS